jgi:RimJ/RimL family protein N-acetyltransferase
MLRINDDNDRRLIARATGAHAQPIDPVIARAEQDVCLGGFMFTNFTGKGGSIWGLAAGFRANWLTRELLCFMFSYIFDQLECRALFARTAEDNKKSLDFQLKLGFNEIFRLEHVYPDGRAQIILRMLPQECKWLSISEFKPVVSATVH